MGINTKQVRKARAIHFELAEVGHRSPSSVLGKDSEADKAVWRSSHRESVIGVCPD